MSEVPLCACGNGEKAFCIFAGPNGNEYCCHVCSEKKKRKKLLVELAGELTAINGKPIKP
jgi:hypothetical protein